MGSITKVQFCRTKETQLKNSRALLWASLVIVIIVVIVELFWLGRSSLAWIVLLLAIAIGFQAVYILRNK